MYSLNYLVILHIPFKCHIICFTINYDGNLKQLSVEQENQEFHQFLSIFLQRGYKIVLCVNNIAPTRSVIFMYNPVCLAFIRGCRSKICNSTAGSISRIIFILQPLHICIYTYTYGILNISDVLNTKAKYLLTDYLAMKPAASTRNRTQHYSEILLFSSPRKQSLTPPIL